MEPLVVGLSAPSIVSAVGNAASAVTKPFASILHGISARSESEGPVGIQLTDLELRAAELEKQLSTRIDEAIEYSGAEIDSDLRLRLSELDGRMEVVSGTQDRAILEAALATDPSIAEEFKELTALKQMLTAASKHSEFSERYSRNPEQSVAAFDWRSGGSLEALLKFGDAGERSRIEFEIVE